jgi:hypothetical protein
MFNENHLVEQQLRRLVPGQLVIFATLDKNTLVVKADQIRKWDLSIEDILWNRLGWYFNYLVFHPV